MKSEFKAAVKQVNIAASDSRRAWLEISSRASRISSNCLSAFNKNRTQADRGADRALIRASERARVSADIFFGLCQAALSQASEIQYRSELAIESMRSRSVDSNSLARITAPLDSWHACLRDEESGDCQVSGRHAPGLVPKTLRDEKKLRDSCSAKPRTETLDACSSEPLIITLKEDHHVVCEWLAISPAHDPVFSELVRLESALYQLISVLEHEYGLREVLAAMETINVGPEIKPFNGILDMEILRLKHYLGMEILEHDSEEE